MDSHLDGQLKTQVDTALELKDQGAAAFKSGDYATALKRYHFAVLNLKGISNQESFKHVMTPASASYKSGETPNEGDGEGDERTPANNKETEEKYTFQAVKKAMAACFVNMSIIHSKNSAWAKSKRAAESALSVDEDNFKAKFRVAQATIRLGEIGEGRRKLEELKKQHNDAAIATEFKVLEAAEAAREKRHNDTFRGFLKAGLSGGLSPQNPVDDASKSTPGPSAIEPRFTEMDAEVASEETPPATVREVESSLTPPNTE